MANIQKIVKTFQIVHVSPSYINKVGGDFSAVFPGEYHVYLVVTENYDPEEVDYDGMDFNEPFDRDDRDNYLSQWYKGVTTVTYNYYMVKK
jgi:hypothetical protein